MRDRPEGKVAVRRMLCTQVIGRVDELSWLAAGLDGLGGGRGTCMFLVGEAGMGKSRLVAEAVAEAARRGVAVLAGRASATGTAVPYQPLTGALLQGLRSRPWAGAAEALPSGLATALPGFVENPSPPASPVLLAEALLRLARLLGDGRGALLVVEDLHWADAETLTVIEYLADNAHSDPLLVLATSRPEGEASALIDTLHRRAAAEVSALAPLTFAEVGEMVASCLGDDAVPESIIEGVDGRAEGVPFLVEELLAGLVNRGRLVLAPSGWQLDQDPGEHIPVSFAQTVADRLAALGPASAAVLRAAAVLGRDFDWYRLPDMAGVSEDDVFAALSRAIDLQLVEKTGRNRFRFRHALTVDAVLAGLLDPQRARLAGQALDTLTDGTHPMPAELVELAAHLAVQADRRTEAAQYLAEEARRALSAGAVATAAATARRAFDLVPAASAEATAADQVLLSALSAAGDTTAVEQVGTRLLRQLEDHGGPAEQQAAVRLALAKGAHASLDLGRARRLCEEALELVAPGVPIRTEVDLALAEIAFSGHQHAAAVAGAEAVLAAADARGYPELACAALDLLGRYRLLVTVELERAEEHLLASLRRAEQADLPLCRVRVLYQLGQLDMAHWRSRARLYEARALAEDLGLLALTVEIDHLLAICHLTTHDLDGASRYAERALAEARRYRLAELAGVVAGVHATITAACGQRHQAEREVAETLATVDCGPQIQAAISGSALVWAALADDDLASAVNRVADTQALLRAASATVLVQPLFLALFHGVAAVVLAADGTDDLMPGRDWAETDDVFLHASFSVARAIAAGRAGDTDQANALFAAGDAGLGKAPWLQAVYRRYAAEAALAGGWGQPRQWLAEAEQFFNRGGHEPLARACRSLLRVAGAPVRRAPRGGFDGPHPGLELTTREADVMALVRTGLTNKQIAGRLYLSARTVEKHVERILAKTGADNRTALAALAAAGQ